MLIGGHGTRMGINWFTEKLVSSTVIRGLIPSIFSRV